MYPYIKALHIIFIVTWFSGMFYIVRLFIYNTEAGEKPEPAKGILREQYRTMIQRLWMGITWPSAVLTFIFGLWTWYLFGSLPGWLIMKLCFVSGLFFYHFSLQHIYTQQMRGVFRWSSQQLRIWNEVATIFLVAIVMLVSVRQKMSWAWGLLGLAALVMALMSAIKIYRRWRERR